MVVLGVTKLIICSVQFSSVQFSLFSCIKSITGLKDLLDTEQVIVLYMYRYLC